MNPERPLFLDYILNSGLPILGICYGMQALTYQSGGKVEPSLQREYGMAEVETLLENPLLPPGSHPVWMSHGDRIQEPPPGYTLLAKSANSPFAAMSNSALRRYGLQFHPEVHHTPGGAEILRRFVMDICGCHPDWDA